MNEIATAIERLETMIDRRTGFGCGTDRSVTTLTAGLRCTTTEKTWVTESDLTEALGGAASGPTPGTLLRAALGSCLAMGYQLRASKRGVELTSVRVTIESDHELAGMLLADSPAPAGYTEIRYHVDIESPAPMADIQRVLDEGDALSPMLDVVGRSNALRRTVSFGTAAG